MLQCNLWDYGGRVAILPKVLEQLREEGVVMNPYDPCVWNKTIKGKQITICFHVDDCKISHVGKKVVDYTVA